MKTNLEKGTYRSPRLTTYDAMREVTQAVGPYMMLDGGTVNMMKRSVASL